MGCANEYLLQNKELNYISKGYLWSLWNLIPIAGTIIMIIKILNRIFRSRSSKVLMFIALIIPVVNIGSAIFFHVLVFERIGGKFLIGILLLPVALGIFAAKGVPLYTAYVERARVAEATSIMGAIITSQEVETRRTGKYYSTSTIAEFKARGIDISDTEFFTYSTTADALTGGFTVKADTTARFGAAGGWITYTNVPDAIGTWASDGSIILPDMLPTQPGG